MPPLVTLDDVQNLIDQALATRPQPFTLEKSDLLDQLAAQVNTMVQDSSLGRVLNGPTWLSGVSVLDGTITADKINVNTLEAVTTNTGNLNVTGTITVAASYPAVGQQINITQVGVFGFNSTPQNSFAWKSDGSGFFGIGPTAVSWTSAGAVTIPVAAISSLTIANVGSGVLGGTYASGVTGAHMKLSTAGMSVWNATAENSSTLTFQLDAATGAMTATGSFTILSTATGAHVKIDNAGGLAGFNATTETTSTRTFFLNAATGAGHLGLSTGSNPGISWDSSGNVSIGGAAFSGGKITASSLSVSTLSAITANLGTITAGTITGGTFQTAASGARAVMDTGGIATYNSSAVNTASLSNSGSGFIGNNGSVTAISWTTAGLATINASRIVAGTLTFGNSGSLNSTGTVSGTLGSISLGDLSVTGTLTIGSGGKIIDGDGSFWDQNGITFIATGSATDTLRWQYSTWAANRPYIVIDGIASSSVVASSYTSKYGNGSTYSSMPLGAVQHSANSTTGAASLVGQVGVSVAQISVTATSGTATIGFTGAFDWTSVTGLSGSALGTYVGKIAVGTISGSTGYIPVYR